MRRLCGVLLGCVLAVAPAARALLVVDDSGASSMYTDGAGAGAAWNYVGNLVGGAPSSVSYVSNGWFVTANHVWTNDVVGAGEETLSLGGSTYSIDLSTYKSITNPDSSAADLCMFRVTSLLDLPAGMEVMESTPTPDDNLLLIGNGYDNDGATGMTWGDGTTYSAGSGRFASTLTLDANGTMGYLSVYDSADSGSAYAQTYDSGGGVFVGGQLAGVMFSVGGYSGDEVTYVADLGTYGGQINTIAAVPEPAVLGLLAGAGVATLFLRRLFS